MQEFQNVQGRSYCLLLMINEHLITVDNTDTLDNCFCMLTVPRFYICSTTSYNCVVVVVVVVVVVGPVTCAAACSHIIITPQCNIMVLLMYLIISQQIMDATRYLCVVSRVNDDTI